MIFKVPLGSKFGKDPTKHMLLEEVSKPPQSPRLINNQSSPDLYSIIISQKAK